MIIKGFHLKFQIEQVNVLIFYEILRNNLLQLYKYDIK